MYIPLLKSHSGLRYVLLASFIYSLFLLYQAGYGQKQVKNLKFSALLTVILTHIQLILGLMLYIISPKVVFSSSAMKDATLRFFLVEHISIMVIAIAILTIAYSKWKRSIHNFAANKTLFRYFVIVLLLILISIPWPFRNLGAAWF